MKLYGLIGYPLSHSFSPGYFKDKFLREGISNCEYKAFELKDISELPELIKSNRNLTGLNVTIPYKEAVIPFLHEMDDTAMAIGAVNTIKISRSCFSNDYRLKGYNTDANGFEKTLDELPQKITKGLILGTGGASKAVAYVLNKRGIEFQFVSREATGKNQINYTQLTPEVIHNAGLIVNTTPLGMYPNINDYPDIDFTVLSNQHILYDLIYNPEETLFLKKGREQGSMVINGLKMLQYQADKAWEIWND